MKTTIVLLLLALLAGSCADTSDGPEAMEPPAVSSTSTTRPSDSTVTTPPAGSQSMELQAMDAFDEWVEALWASDYQLAWDLMAESSQAAIGSYDLFQYIGSEMTEGWGSWAEAENLAVKVEPDLAGRTLATFSGVVAREGMAEQSETSVFLIQDNGDVVVSPFEEFGTVAEGLASDPGDVPLPPDSGSGRRIVYSNSGQRVWIVEDDETVRDTYLVSGRRGVPKPGTYEVFSKSEVAYAGHDGITMRYMVRFTLAESGLAIGFHSIPNSAGGEPLQTDEQLGEFHSAGCVRQSLGHSAALYEWADEGTSVVVLG